MTDYDACWRWGLDWGLLYAGGGLMVAIIVAADIALGFHRKRIEKELRQRQANLLRREWDLLGLMGQEKDITMTIKKGDALWHVRLENNTDNRVGDGRGPTVDEAWDSMTWATLYQLSPR
jgi:hypothetical protein